LEPGFQPDSDAYQPKALDSPLKVEGFSSEMAALIKNDRESSIVKLRTKFYIILECFLPEEAAAEHSKSNWNRRRNALPLDNPWA
jgi:hypothetical protein